MIKVNDIVELNSIEYRVVQLFGCLALILPMKGQSVDLISMDALKKKRLFDNTCRNVFGRL